MLNTQWPCYQVGSSHVQFLKTWWGRILQEIEWVLYSKPIEWLRDVESLTVHWERGRALRSHLVPFNVCFTDYAKAFEITTNYGKYLNRWEYQTCLLRNLYVGQEAS